MSDTYPVMASVATTLHGCFGLSNTRCWNLVTCMSHVCSPPPLFLPFIRPALQSKLTLLFTIKIEIEIHHCLGLKKMASTIRDEQGNPIQLTDEHGSPVHLTDEHGDSVQIIGIATTKQPPTSFLTGSSDQVTGTGLWSSTAKSEDAMKGTAIHETGQRFQGGRKKEEQTRISSTSIPGSVRHIFDCNNYIIKTRNDDYT